MLERIKEAVTETFGEKCADFDANCHGCQAWAEVERIEDLIAEERPKALEEAARLCEQVASEREAQIHGPRGHNAEEVARWQAGKLQALFLSSRIRALSDAPARVVTVREAAKYVTSFTIHAGPENEPLPISIIPIDHPWQSKPTYDASIMVRWTGEMPAALRALSQGGEG